MIMPMTPTQEQEESLITLRALAGLGAHALRRAVPLDVADNDDDDDGHAPEQVSAEIEFWRDLLLHHTRRLLPALAGDVAAHDYQRFAEKLVNDVFLQDLEAIAHHGCDPLTCAHVAHERG